MENDSISSALCKYLQENFPVSVEEDDEKGKTLNKSVQDHFFLKYGVNVKNEDDLFLFKYDQVLCERYDINSPIRFNRISFHLEFITECRGIIIRRDASSWKVMARPYSKFFNQNEGNCPVREEQVFNSVCSEFDFVEKADGTCIQLWCDEQYVPSRSKETNIHQQLPLQKLTIDDQTDHHKSSLPNVDPFQVLHDLKLKWRCSTLGKITPHDWVPELFWNLFKPEALLLLESSSQFSGRFTYLFELCCEQNRIVTEYDKDRLFLIGARDNVTGTHLSRGELDQLSEEINKVHAKLSKFSIDSTDSFIGRPKQITFQSAGITNLKETLQWVEREATSSAEVYGKNPEGFVIYWKNAPLCKLKNRAYVQKHGVVTGGLLYVRNIIIERFFNETLDDIADVIRQPAILEYLNELKGKFKMMIEEFDQDRIDLIESADKCDSLPTDRRNYVQFVQQHLKSKRSLNFFLSEKNLNRVFDKQVQSIGPEASEWIKKNYTKFKVYWKDTKIEELLGSDKNSVKNT